MARNGSGTYSLPVGNPVVTGTSISSTWANNTLNDISAALTQSISIDGQTAITANLPMTGFKHTNVGNATARTEYCAAGQSQDSAFHWLTFVTGTDTITATAALGLSAYASGQTFRFVSAGANTGTSVTLNLNGIGAKSVTKNGASALAVGDIPSGCVVEVVYDGTQFQLVGVSVNHASTADSATNATNATNATTSTTAARGDNSTAIATTAFVLQNSMPAGSVIYVAQQSAPTGYVKANGAALSRTTYVNLFNAITVQQTGTTTNASNSITGLSDTSVMGVGMPISGAGIPAGATVASIVSGTAITISANATASATVPLVVAPFGVGDGSTTFNSPDLRGEFIRGWDDGRGVDTGRVFGSAQSHALQTHTHSAPQGLVAGGTWQFNTGGASALSATTGNNTGNTASETRPRSIAMLACIKY